ncbi:TPA: DUF6369 family protein [Raoultella ornithinolytica]
MIFFICSIIVLFAAFMSIVSPKKSFLFYLFVIGVIPTGNSYADFISVQGVYYFDFYLVGLFFLFFKSLSCNNKLSIPLVTVLGVFLYISYIILGGVNNSVDKYILKDFRPIIMIITSVYLFNTIKQFVEYDKKTILKILFIMFCFSIVHLLLPRLGFSVYKDEYYEDNSYRYLDASTYVAALYVIYYFSGRVLKIEEPRWAKLCFYASIACVLVGNSRFMLLAIFLSIILVSIKDIKKAITYTLVSIFVIGIFLAISIYVGAERVVSGLSSDVLLFQLTNRFSPAINLIDGMSWYNYIFGLGAGTYFDIPWFAYRGLETKNVSVDSLYLTMYVKYGLFGFLFIGLFTKVAVASLNSKIKTAVILFSLTMYFVSAVPYHPYSLGIIVGASIIALLDKKSLQESMRGSK